MNADNFERWIQEKVLPNIPDNTVIVMDNAPCHSVQINKPPTKYATKTAMLNWLIKNNIPCNNQMRRYDLHELIEKNKPQNKIFKIDKIIKAHGHTTLRLPTYMCKLNPIELIWPQIKRGLREKNPATLTSAELQKFTEDAISSVTPNNWKKCCDLVEKLEKEYRRKDNIIDEIMGQLETEGVRIQLLKVAFQKMQNSRYSTGQKTT
ncbi:uncharacterized protein LOC123988481 [Osmia bicornis bicornis]|uniref:uncharacterized protein LOC123988481 n=1 Tax=Osmia bicornis bicornis TaxID=1437191 RepID=UPI001EAF6E37|nr:uncharacterized protein LOC123988481 [Osmia bicornis bicornis]